MAVSGTGGGLPVGSTVFLYGPEDRAGGQPDLQRSTRKAIATLERIVPDALSNAKAKEFAKQVPARDSTPTRATARAGVLG